jgi:sugar-specific transcriptional regulator TrmB
MITLDILIHSNPVMLKAVKSYPHQHYLFLCTKYLKGLTRLSREWMNRILKNFGLNQLDIEVYVYLSKNEPTKIKKIAEVLKMGEGQLYCSIRRLCLKGMIKADYRRPYRFSAVSFDKVLDHFAMNNREEARYIEENMEHILTLWRTEIQRDQTNDN